jgi:hemerythrin-like domain-containing protein
MRATDNLELEHRRIGKVAEACALFSDELRRGTILPAKILQSLVDFLRLYAERYHHEEEQWLFGMLREKGVPAEIYPIATLSREHEKLRVLVDQLAQATDVYKKTDGRVTGTLADILQSLSLLYRDHIWKEDYLLLPMANKILSAEDQQLLAETFHLINDSMGEEARRSVAQLSTAIKECALCAAP